MKPTREEILKATPTQLNEWIAKFIFNEPKPVYSHVHSNVLVSKLSSGKCWICQPEYDKGDVCKWEVMDFAGNIVLACEVWDKLNSQGVWLSVSNSYLNSEEKDWLKGGFICEYSVGWDGELDFVEADTRARSIVLAALVATCEA